MKSDRQLPRQIGRIKVIVLVLLVVVACIVVTYLFLFRQEQEDNPDIGLMTYYYRWGRPYELRADTNRDGRADFRAVVLGAESFKGHAARPREFWEDRDHDGVFEIHAALDGGEIVRLEMDQDADGRYDQTLLGLEAKEYYQILVDDRNQEGQHAD